MKENNTQLVLVETVSMFRMRYVVEVPVGIDSLGLDKSLWALDTVTMEDAKEFSQKHLGETIVGHRIVSKEDVLKIFDEDNDYLKDIPEDKKIENFITSWKEQNEK
jgi:hypothetical protein